MGNSVNNSTIAKKRFGCLQVFGFIIFTVVITAGVTVFVLKTYFFPSEFKPVTLNFAEKKVLAAKLEKFDATGIVDSNKHHQLKNLSQSESLDVTTDPANKVIEAEPYDENDFKREIGFTERELNGLLANNTDLARKLAIDLSEELISAKLILPIDQDFPVLGGKTLRLRSGVSLAFKNGKPVVIFKGITIMGIPIPNAWLGGIKNLDLVEKFGAEKGFWKTFSEGVEDIIVEEGLLKIKLKQ
jgi:hypothetical protein